MPEKRRSLAPSSTPERSGRSDSPPASRSRGKKDGGKRRAEGSHHVGGQASLQDPGRDAVRFQSPQQSHDLRLQQPQPPPQPPSQFQSQQPQMHPPQQAQFQLLPPQALPRQPQFQLQMHPPQQAQFQLQPPQALPRQPQFQLQMHPPQQAQFQVPPPQALPRQPQFGFQPQIRFQQVQQRPSVPRSAGVVSPHWQWPPFQLRPQISLQGLQQQPMFKVDKSPAGYSTMWDKLHPAWQRFLLQIEEKIFEYRSESQRVDQCARLSDSSATNKEFQLNIARIAQGLRGMSIAIDKQKIVVNELMTSARNMMRDTDFSIRSIWAHGSYTSVPKRPSQFLSNAVGEFEKRHAECQQWVDRAEESLTLDLTLDVRSTFSSSRKNSLDSLRSVLSNTHDYFIVIAAKVENLHQSVEFLRTAYLAKKRRHGDRNDPFIEADRQETAKRQATDRSIHSSFHLHAISSQPSSQAAGMVSNPASVRATSISGGAPGSCSSLYGTASSTLAPVHASFSSTFSAPTSSTSTSSLYNSSAIAPQITTLGSTQPPSSSASGSSSSVN